MENKSDLKGVLLGVFLVIALLLGGFVVYDKLLKNDEKTNKNECQCEKCEKTSVDYATASIDTKAKLICTIDMTGLKEVVVQDKCGEDFDLENSEYQIRVNNLNYNGIKYTFTYVLEKDTFFPREDDEGIVKMYVGNNLIDAHEGNRNIFRSLKIDNSNLYIEEGVRSDVFPFESDFNLSEIIK